MKRRIKLPQTFSEKIREKIVGVSENAVTLALAIGVGIIPCSAVAMHYMTSNQAQRISPASTEDIPQNERIPGEDLQRQKQSSNFDPNKSLDVDNNLNQNNSAPTLEQLLRQYEGLTIVDILLEGVTENIQPTAMAAITQYIGDPFSADLSLKEQAALLNTGLFYDIYPTVQKIPEGIVLTYHLLQNPVLRGIEFSGNDVEKTDELKKIMTVKTGETLNSTLLHENVNAIQEKYHSDGYIFAKITDMNVDRDGILTIKVNEGKLEGYSIKGNKKTKEKVILREMRQKPGSPFDANLARRSMQRLYNLGAFEDVNIKMIPGVEPNAVVMEVTVKEKRTGTFGVGAGYSSRDGVVGMVSVSDTNFLGRGDAISLTYEMSGDDEDAHGYVFAYRKPWLDDKETSGTIRIYNRTYEYSDYDTHGDLKEEYMRKYKGGELTLSRPISEYSRNAITIRNRDDKYVRHVSSGNMGDRSGDSGYQWRKDNFGTTRSVTLEHITDTRDNIYSPTTGGRVALSAEFAGWLGGDFTFQKYGIDHQQFFKAGHAQVWAFRGKAGVATGDVSEFNQYRVGGQDTLRGYRDDQFRGDKMLLGTIEYRFPLAQKVQGILFTDGGAVWDSGWTPENFHGSIGSGVALTTPLGALRLDYGYGSQGGRVHFSVGGSF